MMRFSNFMCCTEDAQHYEDRREIVLLQDAGADFLPTLDGSSHWKPDDLMVADAAVEEPQFVFGGAASSWLSSEPVVFSDSNPDSILACDDDEDDGAMGECDDNAGCLSASSVATIAHSSVPASGSQSNLNAEQEIDEMIQSPTDPVGKFLRQHGISARRAVELNIQSLLLSAPKTPRQKYGPRHELSAAERMQLCKDRNRAHAKATRQRKKLFEQVLQILEDPDAPRGNHSSSSGNSGNSHHHHNVSDCDDDDLEPMSEGYSG